MRKFGGLNDRVCVPIPDRILSKNTFFEVGLYDPVAIGTSAFGNFVVGYIGNLAEESGEFLFGGLLFVLQLLADFLEGSYLCLDFFCLFALALLHKHTDFGSHLLCIGEILVKLFLCLTASLIYGNDFFYCLTSTSKVLLFQSRDDAFCFFCDEFKC